MKNIIYITFLLISFFGLSQEYDIDTSGSGPTFLKKAKAEQVDEIKNIALELFASPNGLATNEGTRISPLTVEAARDSLRAYKIANGSLPKGNVVIYLREGVYSDPVEFTASDNGTLASPITYKAYNGEKIVLSGGIDVPFSAVNTVPSSITNRIIDVPARSLIRQIALSDIGTNMTEKGNYKVFSGGNNSRKLILPNTIIPYDDAEGRFYIDNERLGYSRYPKKDAGPDSDGFLRAGAVIEKGWIRADDGDSPTGVEGGTFEYLDESIDNVLADGNPKIYGYVGVTYDDMASTIDNIDTGNNYIKMLDESWYGINYLDQLLEIRYRLDNVLEYISEPGESYIDQNTGIFYFIPPAGFDADSKIQLSLSKDPMIKLTNTEFINFEGIEVELTRTDAILGIGNNDTHFENITVENVEGSGLSLPKEGVYRNTVLGFTANSVNVNPLILGGGNYFTQAASESYAINVKVSGYGSPMHPILIDGVGTKLLHFELEDSPGMAIWHSGQNLEIGWGTVKDCVLEIEDMAPIYSGRDLSYSANIHHVYGQDNGNDLSGTGTQLIYADDLNSMVHCYGIISLRSGSGVGRGIFKINGGHYNSFKNSIIWEGMIAWVQDRSEAIWDTESNTTYLTNKLAAVDYLNPNSTWRRRYPELYSLVVAENYPDQATNVFDNNLIINGDTASGVFEGAYGLPPITVTRQKEIDYNPGFKDPDNGDFSISKLDWEKEPALKDMEYLDFSRYGLYKDINDEYLNNLLNKEDQPTRNTGALADKDFVSGSDIQGDILPEKVTGLDESLNASKLILNKYFGNSDNIYATHFLDALDGTTIDTDRWTVTLPTGGHVSVSQNDKFIFTNDGTPSMPTPATVRTDELFYGSVSGSSILHLESGRYPRQYLGFYNESGAYAEFEADPNYNIIMNVHNGTTNVYNVDTGLNKDEADYYLKVEIVGSDITFLTSTDGTTYTEQGSYTLDIVSSGVYFQVGHQNFDNLTAEIHFDNIEIKKGLGVDNISDLTLPSESPIFGGGNTGQVLAKASNEPLDFEFISVGGSAPEGTTVLSTGETGGTKYLRENGDGTSSWQPVAGGGGGGGIAKTGTPVNDQVARWTDDNTVEGSDRLQFDPLGNLKIRQTGGADYSFHVNPGHGSGPRLTLGTGNDGNQFFVLGAFSGRNNFDSKNRNLRIYTSGGASVFLDKNNPLVGINKDDPTYTLDVGGKIGAVDINFSGLPTSATGLASGDVWNDGGTLKIVP